VSWEQIVAHSEIVLAFGGMALKNSMVAGGGTSKHVERARWRARCARLPVCHVSPLRGDLPDGGPSQWISNIPGTDVALMLALVHTLVVEGRHDREFLDR
jgi:Anaerobic dehydrogenases, typically selenocysteine-containing